MFKKDKTGTFLLNACTSPSILASQNDSGICRSTFLHSQIARMITSTPSSLETRHPTKKIDAKCDPFYLQFGFLHPTQMDVNNTTHKGNRLKKLHTMHNYLFLQHHFQHTNPITHMNSRLQYANTTLTSPYYINYSYIIQSNYCERTLRNFDHIKNYFLFSLLYAKKSPHPRPNRVPKMCRKRCHEVYLWSHLQPPLQGLDGQ